MGASKCRSALHSIKAYSNDKIGAHLETADHCLEALRMSLSTGTAKLLPPKVNSLSLLWIDASRQAIYVPNGLSDEVGLKGVREAGEDDNQAGPGK